MGEHKFKKGDLVCYKNDKKIIREIADYDGNGYVWKYPGNNEDEWSSLNSSDPELDQWELVKLENMENKYYVPDIEEFHVGFEYEAKIYNSNEWVKLAFKPNTFENSFDYDNDKGYSVGESIRVKFLDRQDIEELGWELRIGNSAFDSFVKGKNYILTSFGEQKIDIRHVNDWGDVETRLFCGTIRNKSELARLMLMLNIE